MIFNATRRTYVSRVFAALVGSTAILFAASPADAELLNTVQLNFQNGSNSGTFQVAVPEFTDQFQWDLPAPVNVYANGGNGALLGTIKELSITLDGDPGITLGFNVDATNVATHISFSSAVVTFAPIANAQAFASAAITVTDNDGDGASATGLLPGGTAYQAQYNGSLIFANLILPVTAASDGSNTGSERQPLSGNTAIGTAFSIHSQFDFMLSANDSASGTSRFNVAAGPIVPEPSTVALAAFGLIGLVGWTWRQKRSPA